MSPRGAASLLEVDRTLSTWPQVSGDVAAGAPVIAESVRRIGLGEHLPSGRIRLDVSGALDRLDEPELPPEQAPPPTEYSDPVWPGVAGAIAAAAIRAPSASNAQPWHIDAGPDVITIRLTTEHTSTLDVELPRQRRRARSGDLQRQGRGCRSACAGPGSFTEATDGVPLQATLRPR